MLWFVLILGIDFTKCELSSSITFGTYGLTGEFVLLVSEAWSGPAFCLCVIGLVYVIEQHKRGHFCHRCVSNRKFWYATARPPSHYLRLLLWMTSKSYSSNSRRIRVNLDARSFNFYKYISGRWSRLTVKCRPKRYGLNCLITKWIAISSFSMTDLFISPFFNVLLI